MTGPGKPGSRRPTTVGLSLLLSWLVLRFLSRLDRDGSLRAAATGSTQGGRRSAEADAGQPRRSGSGPRQSGDAAPGEHRDGEPDGIEGIRSYLVGLVLAALLTAGSFYLTGTSLVYGPGVPMALVVFAIAQIGIHLVFFLHLTTSPDNINNAMALAFGVLIIGVLIGGSIWIMYHMNQNMMPMGSSM